MIHVTLVTSKALKIGNELKLASKQLEFIEEASMLHDIGICKVDAPEMGASGKLPYITHIIEGQKILQKENLPKHAQVALNHIGIGITKEEIIERALPLPPKNIKVETIEEKIISYADLFFSKDPESIWNEKTPHEVETELSKYGVDNVNIFHFWQKELVQ